MDTIEISVEDLKDLADQETIVLSKEEARQFIRETVLDAVRGEVVEILRRAQMSEYMSTEEVADYLGVSVRHVRYLKQEDRIPYSQDARTIRYPTADIERWMKNKMPERWREKREQLNEKYPVPALSDEQQN